jgi:hypothetical protein
MKIMTQKTMVSHRKLKKITTMSKKMKDMTNHINDNTNRKVTKHPPVEMFPVFCLGLFFIGWNG